MEKSFVGDPVLWPGLVYSPLNNTCLIFALGAVAQSIGLVFEEFSADSHTAICRRKTADGWERLRVAFVVNSSSLRSMADDIDLVICWRDDRVQPSDMPLVVLSNLLGGRGTRDTDPSVRSGLESILPETASDDLLDRARNRESYEETVRQLDEQIKKLQDR
jgi:hypothetical protein